MKSQPYVYMLPFTDSNKAKDVFNNNEREIKEIEGINPKIKEKIADKKDMQQETIKKNDDRRLVENSLAVKKRKTSDQPVSCLMLIIDGAAVALKCFVFSFADLTALNTYLRAQRLENS